MSLTDDAKDIRKTMDGHIKDVARKVVLEVFAGTIEATPVGNPSLWKSKPPKGYVGGRLRNNWQCSKDQPDTSSTRGPEGGGNAALADVQQTVAPDPGKYYLTNNMPYAKRIEYDGWSRQAPAGMARINIRRLQQIIRKFTK